MVLYFLVQM